MVKAVNLKAEAGLNVKCRLTAVMTILDIHRFWKFA